ncbi:unnamed protein product [Protopolystoma xenopodis]|uniref:Uncharacterized protein n=1 Tax=Protopolystoma xenopodis TaxID=117903 RepID=A0A3S5FEM0_9PLAT|nr:unnamed protein product [Protopolystoma xenopodis]
MLPSPSPPGLPQADSGLQGLPPGLGLRQDLAIVYLGNQRWQLVVMPRDLEPPPLPAGHAVTSSAVGLGLTSQTADVSAPPVPPAASVGAGGQPLVADAWYSQLRHICDGLAQHLAAAIGLPSVGQASGDAGAVAAASPSTCVPPGLQNSACSASSLVSGLCGTVWRPLTLPEPATGARQEANCISSPGQHVAASALTSTGLQIAQSRLCTNASFACTPLLPTDVFGSRNQPG